MEPSAFYEGALINWIKELICLMFGVMIMAVCTFFSWESFFAQVLIVPEKILH